MRYFDECRTFGSPFVECAPDGGQFAGWELTARHLARLNARAPERQHNVAGFSSPSFRYCCCSGTVGLLVVVSCCAPKPPPRGRGRGIGRRDRVVSALRTVPPS